VAGQCLPLLNPLLPLESLVLSELPTPPVVSGALPGLGHMLEFRKSYPALFRRGFEEHGPLFCVRLGPYPAAVFCGEQMNEVFYKQTDQQLSMAEAYGFLKDMFGRVAFTASSEEYEAERHVLHAPFKAGRMKGHVTVMQDEVESWLDTLGDEGRFELVAMTQGLTQQISACALMGSAFRDRMGDRFWLLYDDLAKGMDPVLPSWLPLPKFNRRDRAKAELRPMLMEVVRERRTGSVQHDDVLQVLCTTELADGTLLPEEKVVSYVLAMVFAGFETTSAHSAWALIHLLQNPEWIERLRDEAAGVDTKKIGPGTLARLPLLRACVKETERLQPVADRHVRAVTEDLEVAGFRLPKGWVAMSGLNITHTMADEFVDAQRYDPLRYSRGEGKGQFKIVGFGAARHRCTGMAFAYNEMMVWLTLFLERYDLELETVDPQRRDFTGVVVPEATWIRYRRRASS
jgi:sterol 14alpha-demethylase